MHTYGHNRKEFCGAVFAEWLAGENLLAPTWNNLLKVLRDVDLEVLAKHVETFFQSTMKSSKKATEVMGEEKELVESLQQTLEKVEWELHKSEAQLRVALEENGILKDALQIKTKSLSTVMRRQLKQQTEVKSKGTAFHIICCT